VSQDDSAEVVAQPATVDPDVSVRTLPAMGVMDALEHLGVLAVLFFWAVPFVKATGGRGVHTELLFCIALVVALLLTRAWRSAEASTVLSALVALAALLVCVIAPSGWYGSDVAVEYGLAAAVYVIARRYVRSDDRRDLVAAAICVAGFYEFWQAFTPWRGSGSPDTEMSGTFYWHNPYAAYLLPPAIIGLGLVARRKGPWNIVGWFTTPLAAAGIVLSSSRATIAALVVGWVLVLLSCVRWRALVVALVGAVALSGVVTFLLPGPPFFDHRVSPFSATESRTSAGQSLAQNGEYRTQFWREAAKVALHHPVAGSGYHALSTASAFYTPSNWARSPLAHDGYLQALSDGGLLLGLPFLAAVAIVLFWAVRRLIESVRGTLHGGDPPDVLDTAIAVALLGAFAHSAVDFDWSHASILVETALLAACVAPAAARSGRGATWHRVMPAASIVALIGVLVVYVPALHHWQKDQPIITRSTASLLADANATFGDYRPALAVLRDLADGDRTASRGQVVEALADTSSEAEVDRHLAFMRYAVGARSGVLHGAVGDAKSLFDGVDGYRGPYIVDYATVLVAGNLDAQAQQLLRGDIEHQVAGGRATPAFIAELDLWARAFGTGAPYACVVKAASPLINPGGAVRLPEPSAPCRTGDRQAEG
jgi:O-antigen ligase